MNLYKMNILIEVEDSYIGTLTREEYRIYLLLLHLRDRESL